MFPPCVRVVGAKAWDTRRSAYPQYSRIAHADRADWKSWPVVDQGGPVLPESLRAIAANAGVAVVETAGTELWTSSFGQRVASWLAQSGGQVEQREIARLRETATAVRTAAGASQSGPGRLHGDSYL